MEQNNSWYRHRLLASHFLQSFTRCLCHVQAVHSAKSWPACGRGGAQAAVSTDPRAASGATISVVRLDCDPGRHVSHITCGVRDGPSYAPSISTPVQSYARSRCRAQSVSKHVLDLLVRDCRTQIRPQ